QNVEEQNFFMEGIVHKDGQDVVSCANAFKSTSYFLFYNVQCKQISVEIFDPLGL
ncbi:hypothetical protein STEG23_019651, partial [Scotinomys teguina]